MAAGHPLAEVLIEGKPVAFKVQPAPGGFRMRQRGMDVKVKVLSPRVAQLAALMPEKAPPDTSNLLLCPMPGLITSVLVKEATRCRKAGACDCRSHEDGKHAAGGKARQGFEGAGEAGREPRGR